MSDTRDDRLPDLRYVRELARVFKQYDLDEVEIETGDQRILLRRGGAGGGAVMGSIAAPSGVAQLPAPAPVDPGASSSGTPIVETVGEYITSPFVGTFYTSPNPDAPAFVKRGDSVAKGQTVCIVEAMKLFNEIEAEFACVIEDVLVEAGQPVEFGAKLFRVARL